MPPVAWAGRFPHGLPKDPLPFSPEERRGYLAFAGRICPEERPYRAIENLMVFHRPVVPDVFDEVTPRNLTRDDASLDVALSLACFVPVRGVRAFGSPFGAVCLPARVSENQNGSGPVSRCATLAQCVPGTAAAMGACGRYFSTCDHASPGSKTSIAPATLRVSSPRSAS